MNTLLTQDPYINVARTDHSDVTHWATRTGLRTMCGLVIPGDDPSDRSRRYDPAWTVKKSHISLVTCKKCNGSATDWQAEQVEPQAITPARRMLTVYIKDDDRFARDVLAALKRLSQSPLGKASQLDYDQDFELVEEAT